MFNCFKKKEAPKCYSPLHSAVIAQDKKTVETLLGQEVSAKRKKQALNTLVKASGEQCDGYSPLHIVAQNSAVPLVNVLIGAGAPVNMLTSNRAKTEPRYTPLFLAALQGSLPIVQQLLNAKADPLLGTLGHTPFLGAVNEERIEIMRVLATHTPALVSTPDNTDYYPIHRAAKKGLVASLKCLLEMKVDIDTTRNKDDSRTALHFAREANQLDCVSILLESGATPNPTTKFPPYATPLQEALNWLVKGASEHNRKQTVIATFIKDPCTIEQQVKIVALLMLQYIAHNISPISETNEEAKPEIQGQLSFLALPTQSSQFTKLLTDPSLATLKSHIERAMHDAMHAKLMLFSPLPVPLAGRVADYAASTVEDVCESAKGVNFQRV